MIQCTLRIVYILIPLTFLLKAIITHFLKLHGKGKKLISAQFFSSYLYSLQTSSEQGTWLVYILQTKHLAELKTYLVIIASRYNIH